MVRWQLSFLFLQSEAYRRTSSVWYVCLRVFYFSCSLSSRSFGLDHSLSLVRSSVLFCTLVCRRCRRRRRCVYFMFCLCFCCFLPPLFLLKLIQLNFASRRRIHSKFLSFSFKPKGTRDRECSLIYACSCSLLFRSCA